MLSILTALCGPEIFYQDNAPNTSTHPVCVTVIKWALSCSASQEMNLTSLIYQVHRISSYLYLLSPPVSPSPKYFLFTLGLFLFSVIFFLPSVFSFSSLFETHHFLSFLFLIHLHCSLTSFKSHFLLCFPSLSLSHLFYFLFSRSVCLTPLLSVFSIILCCSIFLLILII